jgi:hypothetical protein
MEEESMEQLFKCKYTGKIFNNELDCIESEYVHGDERKKFVDLVNNFVDKVEKKFNIKVQRDTLKIYDKQENYINDRIVHWRHVKFTFILNGREREYFRTSDSVGDGRWEWYLKDNVGAYLKDFEREFILPLRKSFSGKLYYVYPDHEYYQQGHWELGGRKIEDILSTLSRKNKKIRIETIDE